MARKPPKAAPRRPDSPRSTEGTGQGQPAGNGATRGNVGGRPKKEITSDHIRQIEFLSGIGLTEASIAHNIGISPRLFRDRKHEAEVSAALKKGKSKAEGLIGQALFLRAKGGDLGSIIWWEKTRAGRVDSSQVRHADAKGENLPTPQIIFYSPDNGRGERLTVPTTGARAGANGHRAR